MREAIYARTVQRAHKVRQLQPPPGGDVGRIALIGYRRAPGGPAPDGIDTYECIWHAEGCDPSVSEIDVEDVALWLHDPQSVAVDPPVAYALTP